MRESYTINDINDVIDVLNKHERLIFKNRKGIGSLRLGMFFMGIAGGLAGVLLYDICKRVKDNSYKETLLREQVNELEERVIDRDYVTENLDKE